MMRMRRPTIALLLLLGWATTVGAQTSPAPSDVNNIDVTQQSAAPAPTDDQAQKPPAAVGEEGTKPTRGFFSALGHNLADDVKHIPRKNSAYWMIGGAAAAFAVHPIDHSLNARLIGHSNPFVAGDYIGSAFTIAGAGIAAYTYGRVSGSPRVEHLGMDEIEGVLLAEGISEGMKQVVRRKRPVPKTGPLHSGFSMPSGHATITFTAATILQQHLGYKAGIPTYLIATYVAISRLHDNVHFASDVVMGAATGVMIGRSVTWHGRNFYGQLQPTPGGIAIAFATK
jgi:membrane-associated phospholipid phosphatase